jgi:hypothetical protein
MKGGDGDLYPSNPPPVLQTRRQPSSHKHTPPSLSTSTEEVESSSFPLSPTHVYDRNMIKSSRVLSGLSVLSVLLTVLLLEGVTLSDGYDLSSFLIFLIWLTNVVTIVFMAYYYKTRSRPSELDYTESRSSSVNLLMFLLEILLICISPFSRANPNGVGEGKFSNQAFIGLVSFSRLYNCLRLVHYSSPLYLHRHEIRNYMKEVLNREPPRFDVLFTLKTQFNRNGTLCCLVIFSVSLLYFTYSMFTIERYQEDVSGT